VVDCDVDPEEAKVYLDGSRLGEADEFDGFPQYLTISPGHHVIEFRRTGYQTLRLELEARPGGYYDVNRKMYAGDIKGQPHIEYWGTRPNEQQQQQQHVGNMGAPNSSRMHHYSEKPRPKSDQPQEPDAGANDDDSAQAEPQNPEPTPLDR